MPNKHSAEKALRQSKKHAILNVARKEKFRGAIKKAAKAVSLDEAKKLVRDAQQALDKAAKAGTIKKNTAARKLSRLMKRINKLAQK